MVWFFESKPKALSEGFKTGDGETEKPRTKSGAKNKYKKSPKRGDDVREANN